MSENTRGAVRELDPVKVAKAIHEGLRRNGTVVMYSAAFEKIVEAALGQGKAND